MNEAETRAELIDPAIKAAGWGVIVWKIGNQGLLHRYCPLNSRGNNCRSQPQRTS